MDHLNQIQMDYIKNRMNVGYENTYILRYLFNFLPIEEVTIGDLKHFEDQSQFYSLMKRDNNQNIRLHKLINILGIDKETKEDLVLEYSEGKHTSSKELTWSQCDALIKQLQKMVQDHPNNHKPGNNMRRKIFMFMRQSQYTKPDGKVDTAAVNEWVQKYGYLKKPLMDYNTKELPKLVSQAEAVYVSFLQAIRK